MYLRKSFIFLFVFLFLVSCDGPAGPQGPQGEKGPRGPVGNANMKVFDVTLVASAFEMDGVVESTSFATPLITEEVMKGGAVLAYTNLGGPEEEWYVLPQVLFGITLSFGYREGGVGVMIIRPLNVGPAATLFDGHKVRFLIFPPVEARMLGGLSRTDYRMVLQTFSEAS